MKDATRYYAISKRAGRVLFKTDTRVLSLNLSLSPLSRHVGRSFSSSSSNICVARVVYCTRCRDTFHAHGSNWSAVISYRNPGFVKNKNKKIKNPRCRWNKRCGFGAACPFVCLWWIELIAMLKAARGLWKSWLMDLGSWIMTNANSEREQALGETGRGGKKKWVKVRE